MLVHFSFNIVTSIEYMLLYITLIEPIKQFCLQVRLDHILERISLISDAASTERPSQVIDYLYIGGALTARSTHTLKHLGITHTLCLCANEIGQSESQRPGLFDYRNFSVSTFE